MNTVKLGDKLEDEVFEIFNKELESGKLGISADYAKVFKKRVITLEIERRIS